MSVKLRLQRMGRKKSPVYKVVAADSRDRRDGRFIEMLGQYVPVGKNPTFTYNEDRVLYWLNVGATPTDTVRNLLSKEGILMKRQLIKRVGEEAAAERMEAWKQGVEQKKAAKPAKKVAPKPAPAPAPVPVAETPAAAPAPVETLVPVAETPAPAEVVEAPAPVAETPAQPAVDAETATEAEKPADEEKA